MKNYKFNFILGIASWSYICFAYYFHKWLDGFNSSNEKFANSMDNCSGYVHGVILDF